MDDSNAPATKADLAATKAELTTDLAATKAELKAGLAATKAELKADLAATKAELKADLTATKAELKADLTALETRLNERHDILRSEMQHMHDTLVERVADSETRLLQAFYSFAQSNQQRLTQVEGNTNAVIVRLSTLETRLLEVERRLNMPPAA